jgi:hypothetical protein
LKYFPGLYRKALQNLGLGNLDGYFGLAELEKIRQAHDLQVLPRTKAKSVEPVLDAIDLQFVIQKLKYSCAALNQDRIVGTVHRVEMIGPVLEYVERHGGRLPALVQVYSRLYRSLEKPSEEGLFQAFEKLLYASAGEIDRDELKELEQYWSNYYARMVNQGQTEYLAVLCKGYERWLKTGLLLDEAGHISPENYKNIARSMIQNGALEWTEWFTEEYAVCLAPKNRENAYLFNLAMIHYAKGEFREVIRLVDEILKGYEDIFYNLDGRTLLTRSYLELAEWDGFDREMENFRKFAGRNSQVPQSRKTTLLEIIRLTSKLGKALQKPPSSVRPALLKLEKEVLEKAKEHNLKWLLDRIRAYLPLYP